MASPNLTSPGDVKAKWGPALVWRKWWSLSLRVRLMVLGLAPMLLAFPLLLGVLGWVGEERVSALLSSQAQTNLAASTSHLDQWRLRTMQQVEAASRSQLLQTHRQPSPSDGSLDELLRQDARARGLDFLVLADSEGRVLASSTGAATGIKLPDIYAVLQARTGMSVASYEQLGAESARLLGLSDPSPGASPEPLLLITAASHLPLRADKPNQVLLGGVLLSKSLGILDQIRAVVYPVGSLPDGTEGVVALYFGDRSVGSSQPYSATAWKPAPTLGPDIKREVLGRRLTWLGTLHTERTDYVASFAPLQDGNGAAVGALGVAFPSEPYQQLGRWMLGAVATVLALAMFTMSALFLASGQRLVKRIQRISTVMNAVREGQRGRRVATRDPLDEIATLSHDFDELLNTIQQQDAAQQAMQAELRRTRDQLAEEHEHLTRVVVGTRAGTWTWNVQTGEVRFNERWAEIIGFTLDELAPLSIQTWTERFHPEDLERSTQALEAHFRGETAFFDCEVRIRHKQGHWVWVHDRGSLQGRTEDGLPLWMHGTHLDISARRDAEASRLELLDRLQRLSANVPGVIYQYHLRPDGSACFLYASAGIADIYGCTPEDVRVDAQKVFEVIHPDDMARVQDSILHSAAHLEPWHLEYRVNHPQHGVIWVDGQATPVRNADGSTTWHGYIRDITAAQRDREHLRLAASVFDAAHDGIMITDANQVILDVNASFCRITGYGREEAIGQSTRMLNSGRQDRDFYQHMYRELEAHDTWQGEIWNRRKDGALYAELLSIAAVRDEQQRIGHYVAMFSDITTLKVHERELDRIAHYDALTGIPNRRLLADRMRQAMARAQRTQTALVACMLDLDGFKPVNDTYGHEAGDQLLIEIAQRLQHCIRTEETVARLGGDEFVLLLSGPHAEVAFERVLHTLRQPITLPVGTVHVSASMGVSYFRPGVMDGDQLLREADQALYQSKAAGRDRYTVFDLSVAA